MSAPTPAAAPPAVAAAAQQQQTGAPGAAVPATPYASASLYVGDLAPDVTEALLFEIFNAVGPVASVRVCRDAATRRSLGYAYVNFHRVDDAERALDLMNFKNIRNKPCRIMWSHRDPSLRRSGLGNIFVNHLAKSIDNKQLYDTFSMFGNILSCKVATNAKKESLGYGFVHYESEEAATAAIARVDGKVIAGEKVSVSHFKSKKERGGANKYKYTNVFAKNLPPEFTLEDAAALFAKFGEITSTVVNVDKENAGRAFCFVNYSTPEEAGAAVDGLNGFEYQGRRLYVSRAQKKEEREKELREKFEQLKMERMKKYAGINLYVKNLPDDFDDARFHAEFSKFGNISNAVIMVDPVTKKSRGFGFVCFTTPEEATKAVTELNGRMIDGKPLYVALAQRKEQRRAQLEAQYAARAKTGVLTGAPAAGIYPGANPMMFNGLPPQQRPQYGMYPGQNMMRWNPQNPQMVGLGARGPLPVNYQLMPVNARVGAGVPAGIGGPGPRQGNRGPRNQQQRMNGGQPGMKLGPGQMPGLPGQMGQNGGAIRYSDNVRNRSAAPAGQQPGQQQLEPVVMMPAPTEPLTIKALAAAPEEMRKQMIGERLFPLIKIQQPQLAGKITGMLLEMDNGELIHLLESQVALNEKIAEALSVLETHPAEGDENESEK